MPENQIYYFLITETIIMVLLVPEALTGLK